jgi:molecular chaperone GrpE (heat shock protein)
MSRSRTPTLAELDEQLDAELERVQRLTEDFQNWTNEQRAKIEVHRQKQLRSGEVGLTEYNSIIHSLENISTAPPETITYLLKTFDLLAHT